MYIKLTICLLSADQMVIYYGFAHRSVKWLKRVFFHILEAEGLLDGYEAAKARRRSQDDQLPLRLKERPFLESTPDGSRPDCHVCSDGASGNRH